MLDKQKLLGSLKDKASKIKEAGLEEAKKFVEENVSDETIEKVQSKVKKVSQSLF